MRVFAILLFTLVMTGCGTNKGLVNLEQFDTNSKTIVILEDEGTRDSVLPVITSWFEENGYSSTVVQSLQNVNPDDYIFSYKAKWSWDMASYMRTVEMHVKSNGETLGTLYFDAVNYGGMGKFGSAEERLRILLDVLFGKISREQGDLMLGN